MLYYGKLDDITEILFSHIQKIIDIHALTETLNKIRLEPWWNTTLTNKHRLIRKTETTLRINKTITNRNKFIQKENIYRKINRN